MKYDPNDLLSQIAAQDEAEAAAQRKKGKRSLAINFAVLFMKLTFILDEERRKNQQLFQFVQTMWRSFMALIYIGGIAMLGVLIYSYMTFPNRIQKALVSYGIDVKGYDLSEMSLSRVELKNLKDKDGTYSIKRLIVQSTFSDFILGRIKSVELDGVSIRATENAKGIDFGKLPKAILGLNQNSKKMKLRIDNLRLNNAILSLNGLNYQLPVTFQLTGVYTKDSEITVPLFIREKNMNIDGVLSVTGDNDRMEFNLKINNGTLTLPRQTPENITGNIRITAKEAKIIQVDSKINSVYGKNTKRFDLAAKKSKGGFAGKMALDIVNGNVSATEKETKTRIAMEFSEVKFDSLYKFGTQRPIKLKFDIFERKNVKISGLTTTLNGRLECDHTNCSYQIEQKSPIYMKSIELFFDNGAVKSSDQASVTLYPNKEKTVEYKKGKLNYSISLENMRFSGFQNTQAFPISLDVGKAMLVGKYHSANQSTTLLFDAKKMDLKTPEISITGGELKRDNVFDDNSKIVFTANQVEVTEKNILGAPFKILLEKQGMSTQAVLSVDNQIRVSFSGVSRLLTGEFNGNIHIPEFDLGKIKKPLSHISALFPEGISNVSGKVAVLGKIYWKNSKQITGPLFVSLKDIGFTLKDNKVSGLNTVLSLQSVQPFVTLPSQQIFIGSVTGVVPFQNLMADIKVDNQYVKISSLYFDMAGIRLEADTAQIPLRTPTVSLRLKNSKVNLSQVSPFVSLSGATLTGQGSVDMFLELKDGHSFIREGDVKLLAGEIDLKNVADQNLKTLFGGADTYVIRSGSIFLDTNSEGATTNLNISLDGRIMPMVQMKNIRKSINESLEKIILPVQIEPVPSEILKRQQAVVR